jgi:hypothetical protein
MPSRPSAFAGITRDVPEHCPLCALHEISKVRLCIPARLYEIKKTSLARLEPGL